MDNQPFDSRKSMEEFVLESIDEIISTLKALDHSQRMRILTAMITESKTFQQLMELTDLQKSALGNHLSILQEKNLIQKVDRGIYQLCPDGECLVGHIAQSHLENKVREQERLERIQRLIGKYTILGNDKMSEKETPSIKSDLEVRIIRLDPMRVASVRATGKAIGVPESKAWKIMSTWAENEGLLDNLEKHPIYGFNNPDPSPDREEYGYEFWIKIGSDIQPKEDIEVKDFSGGLYAVTTTRLIVEDDVIPAWKKLAEWVEASKYEFGNHQWLEKHINPRAKPEDLRVDLYCPIKEK
ncbi:MAG: GyrI-like domain-containing protein [Candidatus Hodarchaeota archaeon]